MVGATGKGSFGRLLGWVECSPSKTAWPGWGIGLSENKGNILYTNLKNYPCLLIIADWPLWFCLYLCHKIMSAINSSGMLAYPAHHYDALYLQTKRMEISHRSSVMSESGHSRLLSTQSSSYILANKKLTYIPLVFILSRMWGSFRFLLLLSDNHYVQDLALVLASLQVS